MKKHLSIFVLIVGFVFASMAQAQTMYPIGAGVLAWDSVANPKTTAGVTIPGTMKYQVWSKDTVPATVGTKVGGEISATQLSMTFVPYVSSYPGVQAVFYPTATPTVPSISTIGWSTDPTICAGGVTFGILYTPTIDMIKNLRML